MYDVWCMQFSVWVICVGDSRGVMMCILCLQVKNETLILRIIEKFLNLDGKQLM